MTDSDSEIIEHIRSGATRQFVRLVDRYKGKGMTLAVRMLKNREDSEEALQDSFVRAFRGLNTFEGTASFGTWFYRILYNLCVTRLGMRKSEFQSVDYSDEREYEVTLTGAVSSLYAETESKD